MALRGINPRINALSTLMFLIVLALLIIVNIRMSKENNGKGEKNYASKKQVSCIALVVVIALAVVGYTSWNNSKNRGCMYTTGETTWMNQLLKCLKKKVWCTEWSMIPLSTNEDMYTKIKSGGSNYDVAFCS